MNRSASEETNNIVAGVQFALGVALFVAPWVLGFADEGAAAWTAWCTGAVIGAIGLVSFAEDLTWPAWTNLALGVWTIAAPWVVQFAASEAAMWTHVVVGLIVAAASLWKLYGGQNWTPRVTT